MKIYIQVTLLLIIIQGCNFSSEKEFTEKEKLDAIYMSAKDELEDHTEKISLLASIKEQSYDTLYGIILDYHAITSDYELVTDSIAVISESAISSISRKYNLPKSKVASLVFSYKYEMQTKQEIIENYEEQMYEEQEKADPRY